MMKNYLLGTLGAVVLSLGINSCGGETNTTPPTQKPIVEKPNIIIGKDFGYNIKIEPQGEYDDVFSSKILELSQLVMTKPRGDYYIDSSVGGFAVWVNFKDSENNYSLMVYDSSENNGVRLPLPGGLQYAKDSLSITKFSKENDSTRVLSFRDSGLSGNHYRGHSYILNKEDFGKPIDLIECNIPFDEIDNKSLFDQKFREVVDELLAIYKKE